MNNNKGFWQIVKELSIMIGIGVIGIIIVNYTTNIFKQPKVVQQNIVVTDQTPDYDSLTSMKNLTLVENFNSYTPEGKILNANEVRGVILENNGQISKGYLEIIASINNKPLTVWESIYFKAPDNVPDYYKYGGNIFRPDSLQVPSSDETHLLFPLDNIPFLSGIYTESSVPQQFDLFKIINQTKKVEFLSFMSSLNPAEINSIKIYYECDNNYNNGNCDLSLEK